MILLVTFTLVGRALGPGTATDHEILSAATATTGDPLRAAARVISAGTEWGLTVLVGLTIAGVSCWRTRQPDLAVVTAVTIGGAMAAAWLLKYLTARPRPDGAADVVSPAFPSAHATRAMVLALLLAWLLTITGRSLWRHLGTLALLLGALAVGAARVVLGVHWPTDVLAGWVLALTWSVAGWWILRPGRRPARIER